MAEIRGRNTGSEPVVRRLAHKSGGASACTGGIFPASWIWFSRAIASRSSSMAASGADAMDANPLGRGGAEIDMNLSQDRISRNLHHEAESEHKQKQ